MIKTTIPFLLAACSIIGCSQSNGTAAFYNKDFNWTITIPENFDRVSAEDWAKMQNKGAAAIEKTVGQEVVNHAKTIFVFKSGQLNYFEANYQPFDEVVDGPYAASWAGVNRVVYETFQSQMPGAVIDTTNTVELIDRLKFNTWKMKITVPNKMVINLIMFSKLFDKREFTVNIMYVEEAKGQKMKAAWSASKFKK